MSSEDDSKYPTPGLQSFMETSQTPKGKWRKPVAPQDAIDEFWYKFNTKTPGKATKVIPKNRLVERVARKEASVAPSAQTYETAAAMCRAKVLRIVQECRRVNKKYRDPYFDLESDLKLGRRETLQSLSNIEIKEVKPHGSDLQPQSAKRVADIFQQPQFFINGPTANDVRQGRDGDCWLMAALCTLSNKKGLIEKLCVAHDQDVGIYGFVFHRDGEWISEIVDDFLYLTKPDYDESYIDRMLLDELERVNPEETYRRIYQSNSSSLYFAQCEDPQETWLPLLEKCFAKAHGDYAAIEGGFGGEGIEDLTGGVTSEIFTADILDRERFWTDNLLKVNDEFLFGCSSGVWGLNRGDNKGIVDLHAYSIQKAVEVDGKRLLRLKNPWGKGEWRGAWSDGSKEWTAEWLTKLDHRFGDDGDFWISYDDLLRKYQAFERTRLFGTEWCIVQTWTTLSIPWTPEYNDRYFTFTIMQPGPVVIALSQLDDRYFRGLEGQYIFNLSFRLHKAGHEDYLIRSQAPYRMTRSVNAELELEQGDYEVRVKIGAHRRERVLPIDQVVRNNAKHRRDKLIRIGLAYDLAHSKGRIIETLEEKITREAFEARVERKEKEAIRKKIVADREQLHYIKKKKVGRERRKAIARQAQEPKRGNLVSQSSQPDALTAKDAEDSSAGSMAPVSATPRNGVGPNSVILSSVESSAKAMKEEGKEEDDLVSLDSLSDLSEREMDLQIESRRQTQAQLAQKDISSEEHQEPDEIEKDPWNAVAVVGLRLYYKVTDENKTENEVRIRVVHPPAFDNDDGDDENGHNQQSQGLDVDDSAKDATLQGSVKERKKSIMDDMHSLDMMSLSRN